jgi:formylglycine-generating enzyme required for sulfatase activity
MFAPILKRTFPLEPELVLISAGPFLMGSTDDDHLAGDDEKPQHTVELLDYYIGRYPVTNVQYQVFVREAGQQAPWGWNGVSYPEEEGDYPVTYVSWYDAVVYCQWLSQNTGRP